MGSGSLAAMSVFEAGYKDKMDLPTAKALVEQAILAGIWNDLGSGSNVDITILARVNGKTEVTIDRNCITPNDGMALRNKIKRDIVTNVPRGATTVLTSKFEAMSTNLIIEDASSSDMQL